MQSTRINVSINQMQHQLGCLYSKTQVCQHKSLEFSSERITLTSYVTGLPLHLGHIESHTRGIGVRMWLI